MAALADLEDALTCSICLEIFTNPVILQCLHTLCEECKNIQAKGKEIECPECRATTKLSDVRKDFKTADLIDRIYGARKKSQIENLCEICHNNKSKWDCTDCEKILCNTCKTQHKEIPMCAKHTFVSIKENNAKTKQQLQDLLSKYKKTLESTNSKRNGFEQAERETSTSEMNVAEDIDNSEEQLIRAVKEHHCKLRERLKNETETETERLNGQKRHVDKFISELQSKISSLETDITNIDIVNDSQSKLRDLNSQTKMKLEELTSELKNVELPSKPLSISLMTVNDLERAIITIKLCVSKSQSSVLPGKMERRKSKRIHVNQVPVKIASILDDIWLLTSTGNVLVYNRDGQFIRDISVHNISDSLFCEQVYSAETVTQTENKDIIVGCWGLQRHGIRTLARYSDSRKIGLVHIDSEATIQEIICEKFYYSIDFYGDKIYGLTSDSKHIDIFGKSGISWNLIRTLFLKEHNLDYRSLCVQSQRLILSVDHKRELSLLSQNGYRLPDAVFKQDCVRACARYEAFVFCSSGNKLLLLDERNCFETVYEKTDVGCIQDVCADSKGVVWAIGEENRRNILLKLE